MNGIWDTIKYVLCTMGTLYRSLEAKKEEYKCESKHIFMHIVILYLGYKHRLSQNCSKSKLKMRGPSQSAKASHTQSVKN